MKRSVCWIVLSLAVLTPGPRAGAQDSEAVQASVERARAAGLRDRSPGASAHVPGSDVKLVADEEGGKVVARVTWGNEDRTSLLAIEAAAKLQEGSEEVSLLNLDGLAGGDASFKLGWTRSGRWLRGKKGATPAAAEFFEVCQEINAALESGIAATRCPRCPTAPPSFQSLSPDACTPDRLDEIGGIWADAAKKAETEAVQAGCDELTKLDSRRVFLPVGAPADGGLDACSSRYLAAGVDSERRERKLQESKLQEQIEALGKRLEMKSVMLARADATFAEAASHEVRERIALERIAANREIAELEAEVAAKKSAIKALWPAILKDHDTWLEKKLAEKLHAVCKTYNSPDRSARLVLEGNAQTCFTEPMKAAISAIKDPGVRSVLTRKMWQAAPVGVWFLTFAAGASNQDFRFVDIDSVAGAATFKEIEDQIKGESETNTSLGVTWAAQTGGNYFSLGYEWRNKFSGGKATELCAPAQAGSATLRCVGTTAGAPTKLDQNIGFFEWRRFVAPDLGLKFRLFYVDNDFRLGEQIENEWEAHVIAYFLRHNDKGLNGGIDVAWDTFTNNVTARVFIGQAFDIFD